MFKLKWANGGSATIRKLVDRWNGTCYQITIPNDAERVEIEFTEYELDQFIRALREARDEEYPTAPTISTFDGGIKR